jgi:hypothetical protein
MSTDKERMTAWQFLRWFAAHHSRGQLAAVAVTETVAVITAATWALSAPLPAWAKVAAGGAAVVLSQACGWLALGSRRVQQWITGSGPF